MELPITYQLLIPLLFVLIYAVTFLCNISSLFYGIYKHSKTPIQLSSISLVTTFLCMYLSGPIIISVLVFSLITAVSACVHAKMPTHIKNILAIYILIIALFVSAENIHVQMKNMQEQQINYIIEHYSTGDTITV